MATRIGWKQRLLLATVSATLLIAAMTLPSLAAPTKTMKFQVNSTGPTTANFNGPPTPVNTASAGANVSFWIRATNTTPGSGNPNAIRVTAPTSPSPGFVITNAVVDNANSSNTGNVVTRVIGGSGKYVDLNGFKPLQQNQYITVRIDATTPSCPGGVQSNDWTGVMWTGGGVGSGLPFSTNSSTLTKTTLTSTACPTLVFNTAPHDAATNTKITGTDFNKLGATVQVAFMVNGSPSNTRDGDTVTITEDGSGAISGSTANLSGGLAEFPGLQIDTAGDYNLTASVSGGLSTAAVPITITPAAVCPDSGVSGQQDFATDDDFGVEGQGTLNIGGLTSNACVGLGINFSQEDITNAQQWTIDERKLSATDKITGYATWIWDQPGTDAIPWTQIKWNHNVGGTLQETNFVDLPRCNAGAVTVPMPNPPTASNPAYVALFPTVDTSLGSIPAGACMFHSELTNSANTYTETQQIAIFEDLGGRKG